MSKSMKPKMIWQRIKRGYDDYDVGDFYSWFMETVPNILDSMADANEISHPASKTLDSWNMEIRKIASLFRESDEQLSSLKNEYMEDFINRFFHLEQKDAELDEEKWREREKELEQYRTENLKGAFRLLKKYFRELWI